MERNSESRNRYGNDRNRRQSDQYNDRSQSSDYQENMRQGWERDENQWDVRPREAGGYDGPLETLLT